MMLWTRFLLSNLCSMVLIGLIFLLKKLVHRKGSPRFHYRIWITLLCALLIGVLPVPVFQNAAFDHLVQQITAPANSPSVDTRTVPDMPDDWREAFTEITDDSSQSVQTKVLIAIWAVGVLVVFYGYLRGYRNLQILKRLAEPISPYIREIFSICCKKAGVKQQVVLRQSDLITSPLTFGILHPYVILPKHTMQQLSPQQLEHILLHELMHINHKDAWVNFCFCAAQMLYWMNPFVWWACATMLIPVCGWIVKFTATGRCCTCTVQSKNDYVTAIRCCTWQSRKTTNRCI